MNIKETIALNRTHGKNRMPIDIAKQFWAEKQDKVLKDDAIIEKTYSGIKLVEGLVKRDAARKWFDPEKQSLEIRTVVVKAEGKTTAPYTLWITIKDETGKEIYALTYRDAVTGKSLVNTPEKVLVEGKGWKKIRNFFDTELPKVEKPAKAKVEKEVKATVKKAAKKPTKVKAEVKAEPAVVPQEPIVTETAVPEAGVETPEIPEELVG